MAFQESCQNYVENLEEYKILCQNYVENFEEYIGRKEKKNECEKRLNQLFFNLKIDRADDSEKILDELDKWGEKELNSRKEEIKKEFKKKMKQEVCEVISTGMAMASFFLIHLTGLLNGWAHTERFRLGIVEVVILVTCAVGFFEKKCNWKPIITLEVKSWKVRVKWYVAVGTVALLFGLIMVSMLWGWKGGRPIHGSWLENFSEWSICIIPGLLFGLITFMICKNLKLENILNWLGKWKDENIKRREQEVEQKIETEVSEHKKIVKGSSQELEEMEKNLTEQWEQIVTKKEGVLKLREEDLLRLKKEELLKLKAVQAELSKEVYWGDWIRDWVNIEAEFSYMKKLNYEIAPIVFLYQKNPEAYKTPQYLFDFVSSMWISFACCNPNVMLYVMDFITRGEDMKVIMKKVGVKSYTDEVELYNEITEIRGKASDVGSVPEYNKEEIEKEKETGRKSQLKPYHVISFLIPPTKDSTQYDKEPLGKKWWGLFQNCDKYGLLPIFYVEKTDWEKQDGSFFENLRKYGKGNTVWYIEEKGKNVSLTPYAENTNI